MSRTDRLMDQLEVWRVKIYGEGARKLQAWRELIEAKGRSNNALGGIQPQDTRPSTIATRAPIEEDYFGDDFLGRFIGKHIYRLVRRIWGGGGGVSKL